MSKKHTNYEYLGLYVLNVAASFLCLCHFFFQKRDEFCVGLGKREVVDCIQTDPAKVGGPVKANTPFPVAAEENIHGDSEMRIGMLDSG